MSKKSKNVDVPKNIQAEQAVLGGLLISQNQQASWLSVDFLEESDFWLADHQLIWRALQHFCSQQQSADAVTIGEWFEVNGIAELVGGSSYILELVKQTPSAANIVAYAGIVAEKSRARKLMDLGAEITQVAAGGMESREIALRYQGPLMAMSDRLAGNGAVAMDDLARGTWAEMLADFDGSRPRGLIPPWADLARLVPAIRPGELLIICGRPGMGKSTIAWQIALIAAMHQDMRTFGASLEMRKEQIGRRWLANLAEVPLRAILQPSELQDGHMPRLTEAMLALKALGDQFMIDDSAGLTCAQFCARVRRENMKRRIKVVVADLFNRFRFPGKNRQESMEESAVMLKDLALQIDAVVICLAQLNRECESRPDKRPVLSDLKATGALEENADWVIGAYRDEYYNRDSKDKGIVEQIVLKARDGECGTAKMNWRGHMSRVDELEPWQRGRHTQETGQQGQSFY